MLGFGIALYFALPFEPSLPYLLLAATLAAGCATAVYRSRANADEWLFRLIMLAGMLALIGFTIAALRAHQVAAPVIPYSGVFKLEGTVTLVEPRSRGARLTLKDLEFERLEDARSPAIVRFTVRNPAADIRAGDRITARARLQPPSGPMVPGGFDFARQAYFAGLGGVGYAFGKAEIVEHGDGWAVADWFARMRQIIAVRAEHAVNGDAGPVAAALLTGLRANIADPVWSAMQAAGLAHLLAISGLHMGLIAGSIYLAARFALAFIEPLALRVPVKRLAALIALLGAAFYLGLAGAPIPTQRAFLMTGVAFLAIMIDRNPISMRLVAFAAMAILLWRPESMLGASFQMSFAAVVGLVAFYAVAGRRYAAQATGQAASANDQDDAAQTQPAAPADRPENHWYRGLSWYVWGVVLTSIVATIATSPLAAYHFGKLPTYGIVANVAAVPLTAFWIMPLGLVGVLLLPLGLDQPFFAAMGYGIQVIIALAAWIEGLPGAVIYLPTLSPWILSFSVLGGLWLCLWRTKWRFWGLAPIVAAVLLTTATKPAKLLLAPDLSMLAYHAPEARYHDVWLAKRDRDGFRERAFLVAMGTPGAGDLTSDSAPNLAGLHCDLLGCTVDLAGQRVAISWSAAAVARDCALADLVIAKNGPKRCSNGTPMLDYFALRRAGGLAVHTRGWWPGAAPFRVVLVHDSSVIRPWTPRDARDWR